MRLFSKPQPQEDEHGPTSIPFTEADPDHVPNTSTRLADPFSQWECDEDGWPIVPGPGNMPPIWGA